MARSLFSYQLLTIPLIVALTIGDYPRTLRAADPNEQKKTTNPTSYQTALEQELEKTRQEAKAQANVVEATSKKLEQLQQELKMREGQLGALAKQLSDQQRKPSLPPLENAQVKVYPLSFAPVREAAQTIESLFGTQSL